MIDRDRGLEEVFELVRGELRAAMVNYPPMYSPHEAHSIIREEFEEFWDEVKVKQGKRNVKGMGDELIQVAAMAIRAYVDLIQGGRGQR